MSKTMDLCRPCACAIEAEGKYICHPAGGGVDKKVQCERCGRRRYGMTYRLEEKGETEK